jgi:hypothetical protein
MVSNCVPAGALWIKRNHLDCAPRSLMSAMPGTLLAGSEYRWRASAVNIHA